MTLILKPDYHALPHIEKNRINWVPISDAERQDIRPLRIGIMNLMPLGDQYEFNVLLPLGHSILQIEPVWIKLESHSYKTWAPGHLEDLYVSYEEATKTSPLDGLIVTGAPVEHLRFEEVRYWDEFVEITRDTRKTSPSTLGLCWGGFALAYLEGISKINFEQKLFGVHKLINRQPAHHIMSALDDEFWVPQSRLAGMSNSDLDQASADGLINILASGEESGHTIFETADQRVLMHLGHPEYSASRLAYEIKRDALKGNRYPVHNFDPDNPKNVWRMHRSAFFHQWLRFCYTKISMTPADQASKLSSRRN